MCLRVASELCLEAPRGGDRCRCDLCLLSNQAVGRWRRETTLQPLDSTLTIIKRVQNEEGAVLEATLKPLETTLKLLATTWKPR